jgi:hypothetical protein
MDRTPIERKKVVYTLNKCILFLWLFFVFGFLFLVFWVVGVFFGGIDRVFLWVLGHLLGWVLLWQVWVFDESFFGF